MTCNHKTADEQQGFGKILGANTLAVKLTPQFQNSVSGFHLRWSWCTSENVIDSSTQLLKVFVHGIFYHLLKDLYVPNSPDHDKFISDDIAKRIDKEKQRNRLLDKSVGSPDMARPSDEYINESLGPRQSAEEMKEASQSAALEKDKVNERAREMLPELQKKMEGRQERAEEPKQKSSIMDRIKERLSKEGAETSATKSKEKDNSIDR